eukprot:6227522-Prorocentrum_lima.AAC.1
MGDAVAKEPCACPRRLLHKDVSRPRDNIIVLRQISGHVVLLVGITSRSLNKRATKRAGWGGKGIG